MKHPPSRFLEAIAWLRKLDASLSGIWPSEFPEETDPGFWTVAARLEMTHRVFMSQKIERLISGALTVGAMAPLEQWFLVRRSEWAAQLLLAAARQSLDPSLPLPALLRWALIDTWNTDGCIAFWTSAIERGGKPNPANPGGLLECS